MKKQISMRKIFLLWFPLELTWLLMALEGPALSAIITRLPEVKLNLAAYGVTLSLAMIVESPIIMMMSAANTIVSGRKSYFQLRKYNMLFNLLLTAIMLFIQAPPIFNFLSRRVILLSPEVAELVKRSLPFLTLWPAAIGYRRFYQGILINSGQTKKLSLATLCRLIAILSSAVGLTLNTNFEAARIASASLGFGVLVEAVMIRLLSQKTIETIVDSSSERDEGLPFLAFLKFYLPLALTSVLSLAIHPLVIIFASRATLPLESLAVIPILNATNFVLRSPGLAYQEIVIALSNNYQQKKKIIYFGIMLGILSTLVFFLLLFPATANLWFVSFLGLRAELLDLAKKGVKLLLFFPLFEIIICYLRGMIIIKRQTRWITAAALIEIILITLSALGLLIFSQINGVSLYALTISIGRFLAIIYLFNQVKNSEE